MPKSKEKAEELKKELVIKLKVNLLTILILISF